MTRPLRIAVVAACVCAVTGRLGRGTAAATRGGGAAPLPPGSEGIATYAAARAAAACDGGGVLDYWSLSRMNAASVGDNDAAAGDAGATLGSIPDTGGAGTVGDAGAAIPAALPAAPPATERSTAPARRARRAAGRAGTGAGRHRLHAVALPAVGKIYFLAPQYHYQASSCSGTLIDASTVLTAAHCVYNKATGNESPNLMFAPGQTGSLRSDGAYEPYFGTYGRYAVDRIIYWSDYAQRADGVADTPKD